MDTTDRELDLNARNGGLDRHYGVGQLGSARGRAFTISLLAAVLVIGGAFVIGYLLAFDRPSSVVLGLGTAQRNIAAAAVVATQAVDDPDTMVMVIATSLAGFAILFPIAAWLRRYQRTERWA